MQQKYAVMVIKSRRRRMTSAFRWLFHGFFVKVYAPVILRLLKCQESKNKALPSAAVLVNYGKFICLKNPKK